jgi:hypothetical protein
MAETPVDSLIGLLFWLAYNTTTTTAITPKKINKHECQRISSHPYVLHI